MDEGAQLSSPWNFLPRQILWRVFSLLSRKQKWKRTACSLKLLNKHWCDAVRGYATTLKPRNDGPFSLAHDFKTVYQKFENLEVAVIEDVDADDVPGFDAEGPNLKWLRKMKMSNARMDSASGLLSHSPYLSHLSLENPRFPLSAVWDCLVDQTSLKWLQLSGDMAVASDTMTPLDLPYLERLDIAHVKCPPDCLPLLINRCPELQVLRIGVQHLSETNFETFHGMKKLTSLVLDGVLEDNVFDPSSFPLLKHLVFSCHQIPLKLGGLPQLTSLGLESRDRLENEQTLTVLYDLISQLDQLELHLPAAHRKKVSDMLSYGKQLTRLKIKNYIVTRVDVNWLKNLRELDISVTRHYRRDKRVTLMRTICQLRNLKSLTIDLNAPINLCDIFYTEGEPPYMRLRKLVAYNSVKESIFSVLYELTTLKDLQLSDFEFDAKLFLSDALYLRDSMKHLCFTKCRWKRGIEEEMMEFSEWKLLPTLQHLVLPSECFSPDNIHLVETIQKKAPRLQVHNHPGWSLNDFKM